MSIFENFTNLYPVNKTLRFALRPHKETEKKLELNGILQKDKKLAADYKIAKKIIDEYHKDFITKSLSSLEFKQCDLEGFQKLHIDIKEAKQKKTDYTKEEKELENLKTQLRKQVASCFNTKRLLNKELIKKDLPEWLKTNDLSKIDDNQERVKKIIHDFNHRTTYFTGFNENRGNIYTNEAKSTAISYRLIHQNLPKFLENLEKYRQAKELGISFSQIIREQKVNLDNFFSLSNFNDCLTQEEIDFYNSLVGGFFTDDEATKKQGINEIINLQAQQKESDLAKANDQEKLELKKEIKKIRSCKLSDLYKQILSDRVSFSAKLDEITHDAELCEIIRSHFFVENQKLIAQFNEAGPETEQENKINLSEKLIEASKKLKEADLDQIYLSSKELSNISKNIFGNWHIIEDALNNYFTTELLKVKNDKKSSLTKAEAGKRIKQTHHSLAEIHTALEFYMSELEIDEGNNSNQDEQLGITESVKTLALNKPLIDYFLKFTINKDNQSINLLNDTLDKWEKANSVIQKYQNIEGEELKNNRKDVQSLKQYLDAIMALLHFIKPLHISNEHLTKEHYFYNEFDSIYEAFSYIVPLYNRTRNYLTKKPFSVEKYKLNFDNSTLGDGWDKNKETDNTCVLFMRDDKYYLGVMHKKHNKLFSNLENITDTTSQGYQKMEYKLLPGANKMLPKVFFSSKNISYYQPSDKIKRIRNTSSHTKNGKPQEGHTKEEFNLENCQTMIDFFQNSISQHPEWNKFNFKFQKPNQYQSIDEFYREVEHQGYKINFVNIKQDYIEQCVSEEKLYLFEIYSKDFSKNSRGKPNLQTLYWRELFSPENLQNPIYKLSGGIELFHREPSIQYDKSTWKHGHHYDDGKKNKNYQNYPIIKNKRYAVDTYLLHVPITTNFQAEGATGGFNQKVNATLKKQTESVKIIGIDRGERHLAYFSMIDQDGNIIKDGSLNEIETKKSDHTGTEIIESFDYQAKLDQVEKDNKETRKNWREIGRIKDLKTGYLSQVVHKISSMMLEHNAIVVFEDLNFGFKKGRLKIEKQVYQKLEKMLIDKLNYLVFKKSGNSQLGGIRKALQLTEKFKSFEKLGKQTGFIFYVPAYHTSKICPATGFVNLLYPNYKTKTEAKTFINKFDEIKYHEGLFSFTFDYKKFKVEKNNLAEKTCWTIWSNGNRLINVKNKSHNQWETQDIDLTAKFKELFEEHNIDYENTHDLKSAILEKETTNFYKQLIYLLKITLQIRNSRVGTDEDWLTSPVKDKNGVFFDSRTIIDQTMPKNADANGAYHIALKGLLALQQLQNTENIDQFKPDLKNKNWYQFVQNRHS